MEKTYKRVPFDIELAKKIQSKEVEGRIVCFRALEYNPARIICWDRKPSYPIVALVLIGPVYEAIYFFSLKGENGEFEKLLIELPEEAPKTQADLCEEAWLEDKKKHEFKPFDRVLVRHCISGTDAKWKPQLFSIVTNDPFRKNRILYETIDGYQYYKCIPYEGNEHLVGTTNNPE